MPEPEEAVGGEQPAAEPGAWGHGRRKVSGWHTRHSVNDGTRCREHGAQSPGLPEQQDQDPAGGWLCSLLSFSSKPGQGWGSGGGDAKPLGKNGCPTEPRLSQLATTCSQSSRPGPELFPGCSKRTPGGASAGGTPSAGPARSSACWAAFNGPCGTTASLRVGRLIC